MASIAGWIEKIKTAIYGEEVRGAIWQSLEAMNTEVEAINVDEDQIEQNKQDIATNTAAITALNSRTVVSAVNNRTMISANDITLNNCTGDITSTLYIHISGSVAMIEGRITIKNYVRTGGNPGVTIALPNKRVKRNFSINSGFTATSTNGVRNGEILNISGSQNQTQISINTTETHSNLGSNTYVWFIIMPVFFEIV